jgi:hypothetical protein
MQLSKRGYGMTGNCSALEVTTDAVWITSPSRCSKQLPQTRRRIGPHEAPFSWRRVCQCTHEPVMLCTAARGESTYAALAL